MAEFYNGEISLAFDIYGCPQRCKHCWLGSPAHQRMDVDEVIDTFLHIKQEQEKEEYYGVKIKYFCPDFREPHFGDDYRDLYARADAINGCKVEVDHDFELLSLWRLAHDPHYVEWAKQRGIKRCQLKVFGMEETNDFFHGRKGAHRDLITATERLLDNGILPRWQVYLNRRGIRELEAVLELTDKLGIWPRVRELGEEFNIHATTFDSEGNGFHNHDLRLTVGDEKLIPALLWEKTKQHFGENFALVSEAEITRDILAENSDNTSVPESHNLFFFVTFDWNVYPNFSEIAPWWRLGNLKTDPWKHILDRYKNNKPLGMHILNTFTSKALVQRYGDPNGGKLFMSKGELVGHWISKACRDHT